MTDRAMKYYPAWICGDCGDKHGKRECGTATWHEDECGICGAVTLTTEPRDFGHLKAGWEKDRRKRK